MNRTKRAVPWSGMLLAAGLAGCAVGPDFHAPAAPALSAYSPEPSPGQIVGSPGVAGGDSQTLAPGAAVDPHWWRAFGSPALDAMVEEALRANPDLKSADAALRQAQALYKAQRGALLPTLDLNYQGQQAKNSAAISPPLADNSELYSLHTAQLTVSFPIDVFGGVRRQTESAKAQAEAARFQDEAARVSLISNVLLAAFQQAALADQAEAARQSAETARQTLELARRQAALGGLGQSDIATQEAALGQAEQALASARKSLAQQRSALAILLGREPGQGAPPDLDLSRLTLPTALPLVLPAELVRRRPDVEAAEANLHAASADVGAAIAARLPNIALAATAGGASSELHDLLTSDNSFWSLSAGVAQPIFEGGALKEKQHAAEAALGQAEAQYQSTVLSALKSVADALDALRNDAEAFQAAAEARAASARALAFVRASRQLGQIGAADVLAAEQTDAQAQAALTTARAARYGDTAALFQALGGGV